jgi:hypothetical protein
MAKLGRKPLEEGLKKIQILAGVYLTSNQIIKLGGATSVRKIIQDAGNKEIENLLFLKSKVQ